jgi:lipoyl(octanoyl) transferase
MHEIPLENWGLIPYETARSKQITLFNDKLQKKLNGEAVTSLLVFCQHNPVITLGKSAKTQNLLFSHAWLNQRGVEVCQTERGGDITFHGPGQLVAYPIFDLEYFNCGVKDYIFKLEQCIIDTLLEYSIQAYRYEGYTGVWLDPHTPQERKIAAIGVKCSRGITMHGLALNVNTELSYFDYIVPCGIQGKAVSSIAKERGTHIEMSEVEAKLEKHFNRIFTIV